jgi:hypothetical protein
MLMHGRIGSLSLVSRSGVLFPNGVICQSARWENPMAVLRIVVLKIMAHSYITLTLAYIVLQNLLITIHII